MHNHDAIKILILLYLPKHLKESNGCIQNFINHYILKLNSAHWNRWFNIYRSNKSTFYWETSKNSGGWMLEGTERWQQEQKHNDQETLKQIKCVHDLIEKWTKWSNPN